jgi:hypothetical protein
VERCKSSRRRDRELERAQRLLRRVDLEEVLDYLGIDAIDRKGADVYAECPDPDHDDRNPSFHVCVEDVRGRDGRDRLGSFNCWSHPGGGLSGSNFLDLVARVRSEIWGEDEDGNRRRPREADRDAAATWIRQYFVGNDRGDLERLKRRALDRRELATEERRLPWPPNRPVAGADPRFLEYLSVRGITPVRAAELDIRAVSSPGRALSRVLGETVPAVLFPIALRGRNVNWFARAVSRETPKRAKGRYAPTPLGRAGVVWAPDEPDRSLPLILVEGIFDAERVRRVLTENPGLAAPPSNVVAVLGARLVDEQAQRLRGHPAYLHLADGDDGGRTLSESIARGLGDHATVVVRELPPGTDPADAPVEPLLAAIRPVEVGPRPTSGRRIRRSAR